MNNPFERLFGIHIDPVPTPDERNDVETLNESDYDGEAFVLPEPVYPELSPVRVTVDPEDGYTIVAHSRWYGQAIASAAGSATINVPNPGNGKAWMIERIGTYVNTGTYTQCTVYEGDASSGIVLDISNVSPDIADESQPIWFDSVDINIVATGMTVGAVLVVNLQYRLLRQLNAGGLL